MTLAMGIIKIEVKVPELVKAIEEFKSNRKKALETISTEVREGVRDIFNSMLNT